MTGVGSRAPKHFSSSECSDAWPTVSSWNGAGCSEMYPFGLDNTACWHPARMRFLGNQGSGGVVAGLSCWLMALNPPGSRAEPRLILTSSPRLGIFLVPFVLFATFCKNSEPPRLSGSAGNSLLGLPHSIESKEPRMVSPYRALLLFTAQNPGRCRTAPLVRGQRSRLRNPSPLSPSMRIRPQSVDNSPPRLRPVRLASWRKGLAPLRFIPPLVPFVAPLLRSLCYLL